MNNPTINFKVPTKCPNSKKVKIKKVRNFTK